MGLLDTHTKDVFGSGPLPSQDLYTGQSLGLEHFILFLQPWCPGAERSLAHVQVYLGLGGLQAPGLAVEAAGEETRDSMNCRSIKRMLPQDLREVTGRLCTVRICLSRCLPAESIPTVGVPLTSYFSFL